MGKYELINGLPQILNILHQVSRAICKSFRDLAMRQDAHKLKNRFIFALVEGITTGDEY